VGPSKGHSLLEKSQHAGQDLAFASNGCDNKSTDDRNFSASEILGVTELSYAFKLTENIISNFCKQ
jgi:hypothetical protein